MDDTENEHPTAELFADLARLKEERDEVERRYRDLQDTLVAHLNAKHQKSTTVNGTKFTVVINERLVIDSDALKKGLGARIWNKFTVRKLDRAKLEAAVLEGSVDPVLVARHSSVKRDTPYIRISSVA